MNKPNSSHGFAAIAAIIGIVLALGVGLGTGYWISNQHPFSEVTSPPERLANQVEEESTKSGDNLDLKEQIQKATPIPTSTPIPTPTSTPTPKPTAIPPTPKVSSETNKTLTLSAVSQEPGKVKLNWNFEGTLGSGFKTAYSKDPNPTYPEDTWHYLDNSKREDVFEGLSSGEKYHFRVGIYVGGENPVSLYSNDIEVTVK
ncbi:MAG: hypothetical protein V1808_01690 [Candidatus Daviesbacteria bacterium]